MFTRLVAALSLAAVVSALANPFHGQVPFSSTSSIHESPHGYETFLKHFSSLTVQSDVYLATHLQAQHSNSSFLTTQSYSFQPFSYAAIPEHGLSITPIEELGSVVRHVYVPSERRRDGPGGVGEHILWKAFSLNWHGREMLAYLAAWQAGYQLVQQWHLITDEPSLLPVSSFTKGQSNSTISSYSLADDLLLAVSEYSTSLSQAILVFDQSQWTPDHKLWESVQKASWNDVILDSKLKSALQREYRSFFASEDTYKELGVPWKRGVIFLGPPGNGKTISLKAIMKQASVPTLYVKTFHTYAGDEVGIRMIFSRARKEAPCILVLEDLDSLITDYNRSFFLNEVDGLEDNDGLLLIGTTNHFDKLDPALSNRPSRFDRKYTFPNPTKAERRMYAQYWQNKLKSKDKIDFPDSLLDTVADKTHGFSFAYLKEAFVAALITLADDESKSPPPFKDLLLDQIDWLRRQLDEGNGVAVSMAASWGMPESLGVDEQLMSASD